VSILVMAGGPVREVLAKMGLFTAATKGVLRDVTLLFCFQSAPGWEACPRLR